MVSTARKVEVIYVIATAGTGEKDDPYREIRQYWTLEGERIITIDPRSTKDATRLSPRLEYAINNPDEPVSMTDEDAELLRRIERFLSIGKYWRYDSLRKE